MDALLAGEVESTRAHPITARQEEDPEEDFDDDELDDDEGEPEGEPEDDDWDDDWDDDLDDEDADGEPAADEPFDDDFDDDLPLEARFRSITSDGLDGRRPRVRPAGDTAPRREPKGPIRGGVRRDARPRRDDDLSD